MKNNEKNSNRVKKYVIEGKVIEKTISKPVTQYVRSLSFGCVSIKGSPKAIHHKNTLLVDSINTFESLGSRIRSSNLSSFTISSEEVNRKGSKIRCQSAYSKLQSLKNRQNPEKPSKLFSSVNIFFDRKNSPKKSKESIEELCKLKINGNNPVRNKFQLF